MHQERDIRMLQKHLSSLSPAPVQIMIVFTSLTVFGPHHLICLHGQLYFIVAVLLTFTVGTLDFFQVFHSLLRQHVLHGFNVFCRKTVNFCFLI